MAEPAFVDSNGQVVYYPDYEDESEKDVEELSDEYLTMLDYIHN